MYNNNLPIGHTEIVESNRTFDTWINVGEEKFTGGISWEAEYDPRLDKLIHKENKSLADYIREGKLRVPEFLISKLV